MKRISIFASGGGSNAEKIFQYFKGKEGFLINSVVSNNSSAKVLDRANGWGCDTLVLSKDEFIKGEILIDFLKERETDLIVLAGFLWLVPPVLLNAFPNKIINIHPALLPKYGGKGMHGMNVHRAVEQAKEKESGITIHYINHEYDKGAVIFQASCLVEGLQASEIAKKVLALEHEHFPKVIEKTLITQDD